MSIIKRPWAFWRRVQYGTGFLILLFIFFGIPIVLLYDGSGSCFDALQNGTETGVDCGGSCVRICSAEVFPPKILWSDSFEITDGQYNAVAYIENINRIASTEMLRYTFILRNKGAIVAERSGQTILPPNSVYPIFEGRIQTSGSPVTDTTIIIEPIEIWQPATLGNEQFKVTNIQLSSADSRPRLDAVLENSEITTAENIEIVTTLFNENGKPLTASQTFVDTLLGRSSRDIVFTWPNSIAKTVRSCNVPSDVVLGIDLSGSMNNDGGNPPQPISAAKDAATSFVSRLNESDQVSVVTFATNATVALPLSSDRNSAQTIISNLSISQAAETGFTNTVAALQLIKEELDSERHSGDARKAVVLLTDGLPTGQAETSILTKQAVDIAREIQSSGATLYVIGLGENADRAFISELVEDAPYAYFATTGSDLDMIYKQITGALCESGTTRIDIIPKTKTNFTPLR